MGDDHSLELNKQKFEDFLRKNPIYVKALQGEVAKHEKEYEHNTSKLITDIREEPRSTSEIRRAYGKLKSEFEHLLHHRPSFTKQNEKVEKELKIREKEIVQEFRDYAAKMQERLDTTTNLLKIEAMGGELLDEYKVNEDNREITSETGPIFRELLRKITTKYLYQTSPQGILGFHVM